MPHLLFSPMKKFILMIFAAAVMTSCMDNWTSQYTPSVTISAFYTASGDTLVGHYTETNDFYTLDTIALGDTAMFVIYNQSYANNLVSSSVSWDTTRLKMWTVLTDEFSKILEPTSNPEMLSFNYVTGYNQTMIPVHLVPLQTGNTKIHFMVTSDSKYSSSDGTIEVIVK